MSNGTATLRSPATVEKYSNYIEEMIEQNTFALPMLPQVASQAISMTHDPNANLEDLSNLIHKDQVLAGHVLRIANSAAFCTGDPVVSLNQALARLGMSIMGEIAISASLKKGIFNVPGFEDVIHELWAHALASGMFGKEIARSKRYNVEGQYLCSLLHAIGKPVVLQMVLKVRERIQDDIAKGDVVALIERFHIRVGRKIAAKWKLPQTVGFVIEYYPQYAAAKQFKNETMMTCLSDEMASWLLQTIHISDESLKKHPIFMALNYYPDEVEALIAKKEPFLETVKSMSI